MPELAVGLATRVAGRLGLEPRPISPEALEHLQGHPWPGNVRELENALERVQVLAPGGDRRRPVEAQEFAFLEEAVRGAAQTVAKAALAQGVGLDELASACIEAALEEERGNASAAARRLGLTRRALDYRRRKLGSGE